LGLADGQLTQRWVFDSNNGYSSYAGQGNHNLSVADVDGVGFDEIVYGSSTIDHNGTGLYSTGLGHGDALHVSDMDPDRPGLEVWQCHEVSPYGATFRDAQTGAMIFRYTASGDTGRACAGDIRADYRGYEVWASSGVPLSSCTGVDLGSHSNPINFMVWWDGDLLREFLNSNVISKYKNVTLLTASGCSSNNGSKSTPCLSADIFGDWREEVIWRTSDNTALRIYTTTTMTNYRFYTLMHDPQYRLAIAWQNVAYNQPPHPSFYLGDGMAPPPVLDIILAETEWLYGDFTEDGLVNLADLPYFADVWLADDCGQTADLDLNADCLINYYEFAVLAENWAGPYVISTLTIQENEPGFIGVFTGTIDSNNAGFTGSGFANTNNAVGMYIEWSVYAPLAGTYQLQWRYANGTSNNRTGAVSVGGATQAAGISFPSTGVWTSWSVTTSVPVWLSAGNNRIRLIAEMSEGLANIDWMSVTGASPLPGS
jgi:hypothetical protein